MKFGRELFVFVDCFFGVSFVSNFYLGKIIFLSDSFDLRNLDINDLSDFWCLDNVFYLRFEEREVLVLMDVIS